MTQTIYLASQSPRRKELLKQLGVEPILLLADASEDAEALEAVLADEKPVNYVKRVTRLKAKAALQRWKRRALSDGLIVVADTTVAMGQEILGKPHDAADAQRMLRTLAGQWHVVYTAVMIADTRTGTLHPALSRSDVKMGELSQTDITRYIASGEPMDKAGAYGIQGAAGAFIERIRGSYTGIMGLPLFETRRLLQQHATLEA